MEVGLGLLAGKIITGKIGSENNRLVLRQPVKIASRLKGATKELNYNFILSAKVVRYLITLIILVFLGVSAGT